jgi:arylsulfatase A-like enzyme
MKTRVPAALCLALLSSATAGSQVTPPRPNIVFILADDLGFADVGFNGGREIATPRLDRLAASGARLEHFYVQPVVDWYPTLVKLADGSSRQAPALDGRDAWGTIAGGQPSPHAEILINAATLGGALRAGNWKLVLNGDGHAAEMTERENGREPAAAAPKIELFDLAADPGERRNLADAHPDKVRELRARYELLAQQAVPSKLVPRDPNFKTPKVWGEQD